MPKEHQNQFKATDFPSKHFAKNPNSSNTFWIILVCVLFVWFLVWNKWSKISDFFSSNWDVAISSGLVIGSQISVEWEITLNGDFITHTHTLTTQSNGIFGLKSKEINLNQYTWNISVEGIIDNQYNDLYILDVTKVISLEQTGNLQTWADLTWDLSDKWTYYTKAGIYFESNFFDNYVLLNSGQNWEIKIKNIATDKEVVISYFACKAWDSNKDCNQLKQTFSSSNDKIFTTTNGDSFYKLPEISSWFSTNLGLFGYFINDVPEQEVVSLSNYISLVTPAYLQNTLVPQISNICKEWNIVMNAVNKSNLYIENAVLVFKVVGTWEKWTAECKIKVNPSLQNYWELLKLDYKEVVVSTGIIETTPTPITTNTSSLVVEAGVKQVPLTLDKILEFKSSRWFKILFPSRKISFQTLNVSLDLGVKWINCYAQTNVIDYANKDIIVDSPTVKVYECTVKSTVSVPNNYVSLPLDNWKTFVVEALDPAWVDFANNVKVELVE